MEERKNESLEQPGAGTKDIPAEGLNEKGGHAGQQQTESAGLSKEREDMQEAEQKTSPADNPDHHQTKKH